MPSEDPSSLIILSEIIIIETIIIIGFLSLFFIKKKKKTQRLKELVGDHEKNQEKRRTFLKETYSGLLNGEEGDLAKIVDNLIVHETTFYQEALETFNNSEIKNVEAFAEKINTLVSPYAQFTKIDNEALSPGPSEEDSIVPDIDSAIDDLLADEADDATGDPALDLSETPDSDDEIAEIPDELLSEDSADENQKDDKPKD